MNKNEAFITLPFGSAMMTHLFLDKMGFVVVDKFNRKIIGPIHSGDGLLLKDSGNNNSRKIIAKISSKRIVKCGNCVELTELKVSAYSMPHELFKKVFYDFIDTPEGQAVKLEISNMFR